MSDLKSVQQTAQGVLDQIPETAASQTQQLQQTLSQATQGQGVGVKQNDVQSRPHYRTYDNGRSYPIRESRIKDRPESKGAREGSISIKIELDLEVEVDLYARVKGDVTIGLL